MPKLKIRFREWIGIYVTCFKQVFTFGCAIADIK